MNDQELQEMLANDGVVPTNLAALRAKAAAFDVLAVAVAREDGGDWEVYHGIENPVVIYMRATGRVISAATLAEAVRLAMEAEGER